jgi:serine/threonine protein kinase
MEIRQMKVIREISRGGFGRVEEVEIATGERLARKTFAPAIPPTSDAEREKLVSRFRREVKVQSSLNQARSSQSILSTWRVRNPSI